MSSARNWAVFFRADAMINDIDAGKWKNPRENRVAVKRPLVRLSVNLFPRIEIYNFFKRWRKGGAVQPSTTW